MIKLLIGGSPCTDWSIAKGNGREVVPSGTGWELYKNYLKALDKYGFDFFLYENNKSAAKLIRDAISESLGVSLQYIDSALVSAQRRQRFYGHNIPCVPQPDDRGILLRDILDNAVNVSQQIPSHYTASTISAPVRIGALGADSQSKRIYSIDGKSVNLSANGGGLGAKTGLYAIPVNTTRDGKAKCLRATCYKDGMRNLIGNNTDLRTCVAEPANGTRVGDAFEVIDGFITYKGSKYPIKLPNGFYIIRKLSVTECKRLQTVPDDYLMPSSATKNYKMLGNGWTVEVIVHILSHIPNIKNEEVSVLSLYDGMACGYIALKKLGVKVKEYHAFEIDEDAIRTAKVNFPDIIHHGDAFQIRDMERLF